MDWRRQFDRYGKFISIAVLGGCTLAVIVSTLVAMNRGYTWLAGALAIAALLLGVPSALICLDVLVWEPRRNSQVYLERMKHFLREQDERRQRQRSRQRGR